MRLRPAVLFLALVSSACANHNANEQPAPRMPPIPVHVRNENFLDMNVAAVVTGVSHRLGTVSGNGSANFQIAWNLVQSESFTLMATPIGGAGRFVSPAVNIGQDQEIEMRIGSDVRQSTVVVHEP